MKYLIIIFLVFSSCQTMIELEDVPIISEIYIGETLECILQIKFLSGETECLDEEFYRSEIQPNAIIMPAQSYLFFKTLALKACLLAEKEKRSACSHDIKSFDDTINTIRKIKEKYERLVP